MEGEVSNHDCADGAASVENNGCMRGKCRGGGSLRWRRRRGGEVIAEKGFKGAGGDREGFEGKKGARGFDERSGVRVTWR